MMCLQDVSREGLDMDICSFVSFVRLTRRVWWAAYKVGNVGRYSLM
jgi:hypothetical protein